MDSGNLMGQPRGKGPHSAHLLRRATEQDIRAFRWLCPTFFDIEEVYNDLMDQIHPGTCGWIESNADFRRWVLTDGAAILGISGNIGCGKSVLAAKIIQLVKASPEVEGNRPASIMRDYSVPRFYKQELGPHYWDDLYNTPEPIAYVFCDALPAEERNISSVLSILLAQLCRQNSDLLEAITKEMRSSRTASVSLEILTKFFEHDVPRTISKFYLVLDGCERLEALLTFFFRLLSMVQNSPKILILARTPLMMNSDFPVIEISAEQVQEDRNTILSSHLNRLITADNSQNHQIIAESFAQGDQSSFLWPQVAANVVESNISAPNLQSILLKTPPDIEGLYTLVFRQLAALPDAFQREVAVRSLKLIAVAQRPLDLHELQTALSIPEHGSSFEFDQRLFHLEDILRSTCAPLIHISRNAAHGGMYSVISRTVSLIHSSLEDFLFSNSPSAHEFGLPLSRTLLHTATARVCLVYLSLSHFSRPDVTYQFQRGSRHNSYAASGEGFLSYAAVYVFEHISMSGHTGQNDTLLLHDLQHFTKTSLNLQSWRQFIRHWSPLAELVREVRIRDQEQGADMWLPGFGKRFGAWVEGFLGIKDEAFGSLLAKWHTEFMMEEILGDDIHTF